MTNHKILSILLLSFVALQAGDFQPMASESGSNVNLCLVIPTIASVAKSSESTGHIKGLDHLDNQHEKRKLFREVHEEAAEASAGALVESTVKEKKKNKQKLFFQTKHTRVQRNTYKQHGRNGNSAPVKQKRSKQSSRNSSTTSSCKKATFTQFTRTGSTRK